MARIESTKPRSFTALHHGRNHLGLYIILCFNTTCFIQTKIVFRTNGYKNMVQKLGVVAHTFNPRTWEAEVGGSMGVQGRPGLQIESRIANTTQGKPVSGKKKKNMASWTKSTAGSQWEMGLSKRLPRVELQIIRREQNSLETLGPPTCPPSLYQTS